MAGPRQAQWFLPVVRAGLRGVDPEVRVAGVAAIADVLAEKSLPELIEVMKTTTAETERTALRQALLSFNMAALLPLLQQDYRHLELQSRILVLQLFGERHAVAVLPLVLSDCRADDDNLRITALTSMANLAGPEALSVLLDRLIDASGDEERRAAQNAVLSVYNRAQDKNAVFSQVQKVYASADNTGKAKLLDVYKNIGDQNSLDVVLTAQQDPGLRESALRALAGWPSQTGCDALTALAEGTTDLTTRVLAIRGVLRIIRENGIGGPRAFDYCRRLMAVADRREEKRLVLAQLAGIKSAYALEYVASFLQDASLAPEALQAVNQIVASQDETGQELTCMDVAVALVKAQADSQLIAELTGNPLINSKKTV